MFSIIEHMKRTAGIQSINKALGILSLFTQSRPRLGITEISNILNLPKGTVHGLARSLLQLGFLQQDSESRKYHLGLKIYELGIILSGTLEINHKASGPAFQLAERTGLVSRIAIWDGNSALVSLNINPRFPSLYIQQIGPRIPAYCSAVGKAILAYLEQRELNGYIDRTAFASFTSHTIIQSKRLLKELRDTRLRGYSIDREETILGLTCIGAPIFGRGRGLKGSISISGDSVRFRGKKIEGLVDKLLKTAGEISRSMGYFPEALEA